MVLAGSQASVQNLADAPSPSWIVTEAVNMEDTDSSVVDGRCAHGEFGSILRSHSHLSRSVNPRILRSGIPKLSNSFGTQTIGQAILHQPPETISVPAHRNARRRLSISPMAQDERQQQINTCTGMADRVVWVSVAQPAFVSSPAFQVAVREANASTSLRSSERLSLDSESGAPRYLVGNS